MLRTSRKRRGGRDVKGELKKGEDTDLLSKEEVREVADFRLQVFKRMDKIPTIRFQVVRKKKKDGSGQIRAQKNGSTIKQEKLT